MTLNSRDYGQYVARKAWSYSSATDLLDPEPRLLSLGLLHDLGAGVTSVGGNGLHVDVLAIDVPRWLIGVRHDDEVVASTERVLNNGMRSTGFKESSLL